jgi:transposase
MSRFPSDKHLASWAGVCPGHKQSGGKILSAAIRPSGQSSFESDPGRSRVSDFPRQGQLFVSSISSHRPETREAKGHRGRLSSMLVILYHVLRDKKSYSDLGEDYFDKRIPDGSSGTMCAVWSNWAIS